MVHPATGPCGVEDLEAGLRIEFVERVDHVVRITAAVGQAVAVKEDSSHILEDLGHTRFLGIAGRCVDCDADEHGQKGANDGLAVHIDTPFVRKFICDDAYLPRHGLQPVSFLLPDTA